MRRIRAFRSRRIRDGGRNAREGRTGGVAGSPVSRVTGQGTGVDEGLNLVLVSLGEEDGVEVDREMSVHREGTFVGHLSIDEVGDDGASGHTAAMGSEGFPRKGDRVESRARSSNVREARICRDDRPRAVDGHAEFTSVPRDPTAAGARFSGP